MTVWISPSASWSFDDLARKRFESVWGYVKGESLLDVGCRDGTFALTFAQAHPQVRVVGIDTDPEAVDMANLKALAEGIDNATFFQISIFDSFGVTTLSTFDTVLCMETLEHLPPERVPEAMERLRAYLKPKGRLIITTPANSHISDPDHKRIFFREELHGQVTWIPDMPFLWLGYYLDKS